MSDTQLAELKNIISKLSMSSKYTVISEMLKTLADELSDDMRNQLHSGDKQPPSYLGDCNYTGYLVVVDQKFMIADYLHNVLSDEYYFIVDDHKYEQVDYWMKLPVIPSNEGV